MKKWLNKDKKMLSIVGCFGIAFLGIVGYWGIHSHSNAEKMKTLEKQLASESSLVEKIQKEIDKAYIDNNQVFLAKDFDEQDLKQLEKNIKVYQEKKNEINDSWSLLKVNTVTHLKSLKTAIEKPNAEFTTQLKTLKIKLYSQKQLNQLFKEKYLDGDTINKNVVIIDNLELKMVTAIKDKYVTNKNEPYNHVLQDGLKLAEDQLNKINETKQFIESMFTNGNPNDKATSDNLTHAKDLVSHIKNPKIVNALNNKLKAVELKLKKENEAKQEKIKQELEEKAKETGGIVEKQSDGSYVLKSNDGKSTQPSANNQQSNSAPSGNQSSNGQTTTQNGSTNVQPQPSQPEPKPQPVVKYTVWYTASNPSDAQYNLLTGQKIFNTEAEATSWLDNYADSLLMKNVTSSSYGVSTYITE